MIILITLISIIILFIITPLAIIAKLTIIQIISHIFTHIIMIAKMPSSS